MIFFFDVIQKCKDNKIAEFEIYLTVIYFL